MVRADRLGDELVRPLELEEIKDGDPEEDILDGIAAVIGADDRSSQVARPVVLCGQGVHGQ
jgi:hypothetical protein